MRCVAPRSSCQRESVQACEGGRLAAGRREQPAECAVCVVVGGRQALVASSEQLREQVHQFHHQFRPIPHAPSGVRLPQHDRIARNRNYSSATPAIAIAIALHVHAPSPHPTRRLAATHGNQGRHRRQSYRYRDNIGSRRLLASSTVSLARRPSLAAHGAMSDACFASFIGRTLTSPPRLRAE